MRIWRSLLGLLFATSTAAADTPHREGDYGGVAPGQGMPARDKDPGKPARPKKPPPKGTLSWLGFEARDGGAQVFFQSVAPFTVTQRVEGATLIAELDLTRMGTNFGRAIDTRFFDNPLSRITARKAKRGKRIEVRIAFKNPRDAREGALRTETGADGMSYVYLTFPEGADAGAARPPSMDEPER